MVIIALFPKEVSDISFIIYEKPSRENRCCCDERGNKYDYARGDICPNKHSSVMAIDWLKISEPDYYD